MNAERYEYQKGRSANQFYFYSDGPKGRILKAVLYSFLYKIDGFCYFNVGFGDLDRNSGKINDLMVSDNKDQEKILVTVAVTAVEFTNQTKKCRLLISGSTAARTRLYQMKIAAHYDMISELFDIQGRTKDEWKRFRRGENYLGFRFERFKFEV